MADKKSFMRIALAPTRDIVGPPTPIVPFADWDYFYMGGTLEWRAEQLEIGAKFLDVTVPCGFVTDLASIPRIFWSILSPQARYSYAAIIHDYLYWFQPCDRKQADDVLRQAMRELNVSRTHIAIIYDAVRVAGALAWKANAAHRDAGERRVLSKFPGSVNVTWLEWKVRPGVFDN